MLVGAGAAQAHDADVIYVQLREGGDAGFVEHVTMSAPTLAMLAPVDADSDGELTQADLDARADALKAGVWEQAKLSPCTRSAERATLQPGYVELTARFTCGPGELSQEYRWLQVLPPNYRVVLGTQLEGEASAKAFAQGTLRTLHVPRPEAASKEQAAAGPIDFAAGLLLLALVVAALTLKRHRLALAGAGLFLIGFWLVHRLFT